MPLPQQCLESDRPSFDNADSSDSFNLFYKSILAADSLTDFETNLFSFMGEVLRQRTCLLYSNVSKNENKVEFTLQRGSYSAGISGTMLRKTFPTVISLNTGEDGDASNPSHSQQDGQFDNFPATNFFSVENPQSPNSFLLSFQKHGNSVRCGMLLRSARNIHGVLLYEQPLYHPYLKTFLRLQQFQEFLALALDHRQTVNYATQDQLTDMYRKYYFLNLVERQLYNPGSDRDYQLLIIDIDYFKKFNDTYGHLEGDHSLRAIAKAIKNSVRTRDITGRFGGEEFICLIQSDLQQVLTVSRRIHQTISKIRLLSSADQVIPVPTVSIGIAEFRPAETLNQLIERADTALYQAKQKGRNQTVISSL
ncbi:GGDEF domain-containing protein [Candidatus Haliotispira prima]|uniref:diguanylate cyclase n=1 Tax=Candidatus Haliotispira prima TaxID=3034016 RepID=A0ABY8MJP2_9SPIO|nr:GGDEF domain-containing protein [Candidatus Haliotispira prima]